MTDTANDAEKQGASSAGPRELPRLFWVGMAGLLIVIVLLGFGSTYGRQLVMGQEIGGFVAPWVTHLHAAVFGGWMVLLLGQTVLAARGRVRTHMTLGSYGGLTMGIAVVLVGSLIYYRSVEASLAKDPTTWTGWPDALLATMQSWFSLVGFAVLLGLGLLHRKRPAVHKRYMICGTILLVVAATSRMNYLLGSWANTIGIAIMVTPLFAYDVYTERRVRPATLIGTGWVGVSLVLHYL